MAAGWFPAVATGPPAATLPLAAAGAIAGSWSGIAAGPLLLPLIAGVVLSVARIVVITLPPWLMAPCYALVGWSIGLRPG